MSSIVASKIPIPSFPAPPEGALTDEMLAAFKSAGVLVLTGYAEKSACDTLRQRAEKLVEEFDPASVSSVFSTTENEQHDDSYFIDSGDKIRFFFENNAFNDDGSLRQGKHQSLNKLGHAMHDLDPVFDRFSRTVKLAETVRSLGYEDPAILQSMYIFKPPRIGGEVVCHQDSTYIYTEPESCTGFWFALEDATIENGCMQFIPGGHRSPLRQRNRRIEKRRVATETIDETPWNLDDLEYVEASAGTLVIFGGRAPHLSEANRSSSSRHAYTLHVIDRTCDYPQENWLQRDANLPLRGFE